MAILQKKRSKNAQQTTLHPLKRSIMYQILSFCLKNRIWNLKCACQHLPLGLLSVLERSQRLKLLSKWYQIVVQYLRNK